MGSRLAVCWKLVPDTAAPLRVAADGITLDRTGVALVANPYDEFALEQALRLREHEPAGTEVVLLTLADATDGDGLFHGLAMGADRALVLEASAATAADPSATATALADALRDLAPDLVLCGDQAVDDQASQVGARIAGLLGWPLTTGVRELRPGSDGVPPRAVRLRDGRHETFALERPGVVTFVRGPELPRYPSLPAIFAAGSRPVTRRRLPPGEALPGCRRLALAAPGEQRAGRIVTAEDPGPAAAELLTLIAQATHGL